MVYYSTSIPLLIVTMLVILSSLRACLAGAGIQPICRYGVESDAIILSIELIKAKESGSLGKIKFRVQVQPYDQRNYIAEFDQASARFQFNQRDVGRKVRIRFDPKCPEQVLLIKRF